MTRQGREPSPQGRTPLQAARSQRGLTQEALAYRAGLSLATIARAESGRCVPTRGTCRLLSIALGVRVEDLFPPNESEAAASSAATPRQVAEAVGDHGAA